MSHWTQELFTEHPQLFLGAFETRLEQSYDEVVGLLNCLQEQGFQPQRLLDLNCGIGRHSVELGRQGIEVLGTDLSPEYIRIATKRAKEEGVSDRLHFWVVDMRHIAEMLADEKPFDGIACLWTSFGFYDDETNIDVLKQALGLVKAGGFLALEIINRDWIVQSFQEQGFERWKDWIVLEERRFNPVDSRIYNKWTFLKQKDEKNYILDKTVELDHRLWSLHELTDLLQKAGWRFKAAYPGFSPGAIGWDGGLSYQAEGILQSRMLLVIGERTERD